METPYSIETLAPTNQPTRQHSPPNHTHNNERNKYIRHYAMISQFIIICQQLNETGTAGRAINTARIFLRNTPSFRFRIFKCLFIVFDATEVFGRKPYCCWRDVVRNIMKYGGQAMLEHVTILDYDEKLWTTRYFVVRVIINIIIIIKNILCQTFKWHTPIEIYVWPLKNFVSRLR